MTRVYVCFTQSLLKKKKPLLRIRHRRHLAKMRLVAAALWAAAIARATAQPAGYAFVGVTSSVMMQRDERRPWSLTFSCWCGHKCFALG